MPLLSYSQVAQVRENSTNAVSIYSPPTGRTAQLFLKIANVSGDAAAVRVFHDGDGTTYDQSTAIVYDMLLFPGDLLELDHIFIKSSIANIAYRSSVANALIVTVYGVLR